MQSHELAELSTHKIVAIVRGIPAAKADHTAEALAEGGIRLIEVTMNSEGALETITRWRERYGNRLRVGAGTVLDLNMAKAAITAGAEFLISPALDESVVAYGVEQGIEVWPGTLTPTEIVRAWKAGARAVKVFPLGTLGAQYLKDVRAPLGHIPIMAVGGVDLGNISEFINAGAVAVGIGGNLVDKKLIEANQFDDLRDLAAQYVKAVSTNSRRTAT